jgi:hypothetical protein
MTAVIIDLNVRTEHGWTYSGIEDVRGPLPNVGDPVAVIEVESFIGGAGIIRKISNRLIYIEVDWATLAELPRPLIDETDTTAAQFDAMWATGIPVDTDPGSRTFGTATKVRITQLGAPT